MDFSDAIIEMGEEEVFELFDCMICIINEQRKKSNQTTINVTDKEIVTVVKDLIKTAKER